MSELPPPAARYESRQTPSTNRNLGSRLLLVAVIPVVVATLLAAAAVIYLLSAPSDASPGLTWTVLGIVFAGCVAAIVFAVLRARILAADLRQRTDEVRGSIARFREELHQVIDQWGHGEEVSFRVETPMIDDDELSEVQNDLLSVRHFVLATISELPKPQTSTASVAVSDGGRHARVDVFVNLARRLQSLVHREIQLLDDLEAQVEDPDLLKGLFAVDHLATRIRRHAENLAVLGGAVTSRQWSKPVNMYVVLRSAVAEVESYSRVKLVRPIEGHLQGHAVADVIHLVAELVENATSFSNPSTHVMLRAQKVTAGIALEVEDRGLGMPREDQSRLNAMLAAPDQVDVAELLNDGRIGLYVVSTLARRHGVAVQLQTNIYGGTQAIIVLPNAMLGEALKVESKVEPPKQIEQHTAQAPIVQLDRRDTTAPEPAVQLDQRPMPRADSIPGREQYSRPTPGPSSQPAPAPRRPQPYAGRGGSTTGSMPKPRPSAGRQPEPAGESQLPPQTDPPSYASMVQNISDEPMSPGVAFGTSQNRSTNFDTGNLNETTGVIHMGPIPDEIPKPIGREAEPERRRSAESDPRPQLPKRRSQTHLAPELREAAAPPSEQVSDHDPGLMRAFQQGVSRADPAADVAEGRFDGAS